MTRVDIGQAKTHLSCLLREVEQGGEVVIERDGLPVARLVPIAPRRRTFGQFAGTLSVPDDFDEPLRDDVLDAFR